MTREKIAILGGGFGGLTTAWHLSRTAELRARYEVTLYQMGWRLGGKCATGRDAQDRILEHGLHYWFGCYDNAWALLREVYAAWERPPGCPFETGLDAFEAQSFTPLWTRVGDGWGFYNVDWPTNDDMLGSGSVGLSLRGMLSQIASLLERVLTHGRSRPEGGEAAAGGEHAHKLLSRIRGHLAQEGAAQEELHARLCELGEHFRPGGGGRAAMHAPDGPDRAPIGDLISDVLHMGAAFSAGLVWDVLIRGKSADALNAIEFRDWLKSHGCEPAIADGSAAAKAIYDCCFWYVDGDHRRPSVGAATALRVILRIVATYKTAVMFTLRTGMAEAVVAPMYDVLRARGVRFAFFHRVSGLHLDAASQGIERISIDRQARVAGGSYAPTRVVGGIPIWPAEPFWDQLENGAALKAAGVDFESHWSPGYPVEPVELRRGEDFDRVVLAISMGGYKPLNPQEPGLAAELVARGGPFAAMVNGIGLVPTMAAQVWLPQDTAALGWSDRPATVAGPDPLDIWADMSLVTAHEGGDARSVHYLCGAFHTDLHRRPASARTTPAEGLTAVGAALDRWIADHGAQAWPGRDPAAPVPAADRYLRANIDPTECCVGSAAGEVAHRLGPDGTGFDNLCLAGCYTRTGLNTTCVEAAVMSGMQAARAISGSPAEVLGEHFVIHNEGKWT